jgi:hypothetical protein
MIKLSKKNPQKTQIFLWKPIEGFNLEPKFLTWTPSKLKNK